jgi:hypothetical protein
MDKSPAKIEQLLRDLEAAAALTQKVLSSESDGLSQAEITQSIEELKHDMGKPDWRMMTQTSIQGTDAGVPVGLALEMSFVISMKPLIRAVWAQTTIKNEQLGAYLKQLKPDANAELEAIIQETLAPQSGGFLTDYSLQEFFKGETPKEAMKVTPPAEGIVRLSLLNQEVRFDYHELLLPYVRLKTAAFQSHLKVAIEEFQSPNPIHHTFTWTETTEASSLEMLITMQWLPLTA